MSASHGWVCPQRNGGGPQGVQLFDVLPLWPRGMGSALEAGSVRSRKFELWRGPGLPRQVFEFDSSWMGLGRLICYPDPRQGQRNRDDGAPSASLDGPSSRRLVCNVLVPDIWTSCATGRSSLAQNLGSPAVSGLETRNIGRGYLTVVIPFVGPLLPALVMAGLWVVFSMWHVYIWCMERGWQYI
ncbi:hypothetical protein NEOLEDRAFT_1177624 [Neolentinus lepideus HHB14362 ss-1]|uniref:Uncharacterized protein n=1 Tax=Neolentinus lepideus HHB14362 ss-1 TaxID=1314782 RepID=A0A165TGT5_9AGAM|nr:hypothetical protein NEOLEDRAFT_1177624 [Neolentinus lepideus HHB14362 ss-1]